MFRPNPLPTLHFASAPPHYHHHHIHIAAPPHQLLSTSISVGMQVESIYPQPTHHKTTCLPGPTMCHPASDTHPVPPSIPLPHSPCTEMMTCFVKTCFSFCYPSLPTEPPLNLHTTAQCSSNMHPLLAHMHLHSSHTSISYDVLYTPFTHTVMDHAHSHAHANPCPACH